MCIIIITIMMIIMYTINVQLRVTIEFNIVIGKDVLQQPSQSLLMLWLIVMGLLYNNHDNMITG